MPSLKRVLTTLAYLTVCAVVAVIAGLAAEWISTAMRMWGA